MEAERPARTLGSTTAASVLRAGCLVALATVAAPLRAAAQDAPIVFTAIGDAPYGDSEVSIFQGHIDSHNVYSPSAFFVHLGDIKAGSESCAEFRYSRVADMMHMLAVPAYIVPGDNETIDCVDPIQAWQLWTQYFMGFEQFFCGTPATARQAGRPENFAFVKNGVLFVGINLVGGTNNTQIMLDDADWASQQLQAHQSSVRAAVFFAQAGPGGNRSTFFNPFVQSAAAFAKPILYLHGDGHVWLQNRPFSGAQNVLRVQVDRGNLPPVLVSVTMDTVDPFQFNRDPWPAGTLPYNHPPCVNAGPDRTLALSETTTLVGAATDNWVPNNPPVLTYAWSQVSGPGSVSFSAPNALTTTASFSESGTYEVSLTAHDGALAGSDQVQITVQPASPTNSAPVANAGPDQTITLPASAILDGTVSDDGLPNPPGTLTTSWAVVSGPGPVTFQDANAVDTQASFTTAGTYVLSLTAHDGALAGSDQVQITVQPAPGAGSVARRIATGSDDAEESPSGSMNLTSSDIDLVDDGVRQTVGLRFTDLTIPAGATISTAYIQFQADETQSGTTTLTIQGQAADNPGTFTSATRNVSSRARTVASVNWSPPPWTLIGEAGPNQRTPELRSVIQEIVSRPSWASGNALVIIITGSGLRTAESYEGLRAAAALLQVEFGGAPPATNSAPVANAGPDQTITLPASAILDGTVSDDGLPNPPGTLTTSWAVVSGPGPVTFQDANAVDTQASFTTAGTYVLSLTAHDGALAGSDQVQITVQPAPGAGSVARRIATGSDDAEEAPTGKVSLSSTDLELVYDKVNQTVGLRFTNVTIPPGATIDRAYIQFQADEKQSVATTLTIQGQAVDHASTFTTSTGNVSSRPRTTGSVSWSPAAWTLVGEAGPNQRTPELKTLIQEIVARPGWASGNALAIIITGTGHRTAESYEGTATGAPLLHVEYTSGALAAGGPSPQAAEPDPARSAPGAAEGEGPRLPFALHGIFPNPTRGPLTVEFSLADGQPATLDVLDVTGRRVAARDVGSWGPGRHRLELGEALPAGVYLVRITQGSQTRMTKAVRLQ